MRPTGTTELRIYTLPSAAAVRDYTASFWPRHIASLRKYGSTVHGLWVDVGPTSHRVIALIGYPHDTDPPAIAERYRASAGFDEDHADFDMSPVGPPIVARLALTG
ncbi:MAG: NIPSNAP domain-containing protein [Actinomycetota bacterium]